MHFFLSPSPFLGRLPEEREKSSEQLVIIGGALSSMLAEDGRGPP